MPNPALLFGQGLTTLGPYPYMIQVDGADVTQRADLHSITFQDNGDDQPGVMTARLWDPTNSLVVNDIGIVSVYEQASNEQVWLGTIQRKSYDPAAVGRWIDLQAISISALLDEILVVRETRPAESDRARVLYLWGKYSRSPLSGDVQHVKQTDSEIPADDILNMTLRSALRQTMGLAGSATRMSIDQLGRLHWWSGSETNPAPYNINRNMTPGGGAIAPDLLKVERDGIIKNRVYVRGANDAGSGWYQDDASVAQYGPRESYIDAPSSDSAAKAQSIANLYFGRVADPRTRGQFQTEEPYNGWRSGQNVTITDPANDLSAASFRIVRVKTSFTKGTGTRRYEVEFGSTRASSTDDVSVTGGEPGISQGIAGQMVLGDIFDQFGNLMLSSATTGSYGGFGPAIRRYITSGVYNGDFAIPPNSPDSTINESWNPLPFWDFVQAGGTAITALSVEDPSSGSGRVLRFDMAGGGSAADDSYIEQLIPINASRSQTFAYRVRVALQTGPTVSNAKFYLTAQYLKNDGVTTTGTAGSLEQTTTSQGASTVVDRGVVANSTDGQDGGQVPADAYFLRVRVGLKRDAEATTTSEQLSVLEVVCIPGLPNVMVTDLTTPANVPARIQLQDGSLIIAATDVNPVIANPSIAMTVATARIGLGATVIGTGSALIDTGSTAFPASPSTNDLFYRTDLGMWFLWDGTRWVCTCPHTLMVHPRDDIAGQGDLATEISATTTAARMGFPPRHGGNGVYFTSADTTFFVNGGTALSASHSWVGTLSGIDSAGASTGTVVTVTINSGASSAWRTQNDVINAVPGGGTIFYQLAWTKTGTPGPLRSAMLLSYRVVAT